MVHILPEGEPVCGVTSFGGEIYVLRWKEITILEIEVYDAITYRSQRCLPVPFSGRYTDMTSCEHNQCMYLSDAISDYVHKLDAVGQATQWAVNGQPRGLSVNDARLLVTFLVSIREFNSRGAFLREIHLPDTVINPWQARQLTTGQFVLCQGDRGDAVRSVSIISADGRHIVHTHGGQNGPNTDQYEVPRHLAVDSNEYIFALDVVNRRVTLLSPTLEYVRDIVTPEQLSWFPYRMCLDVRRRRLYVTDSEYGNAGRVVVFAVHPDYVNSAFHPSGVGKSSTSLSGSG